MSTEETPLLREHQRAGAQIKCEDGWWMPVKYPNPAVSITSQTVQIFDCSDHGQIEVMGPEAEALIRKVWREPRIPVGGGGLHTDVTFSFGRIAVYRLAEFEYLVLTAPAKRLQVLDQLTRMSLGLRVSITEHTHSRALLYVRGGDALKTLDWPNFPRLSENQVGVNNVKINGTSAPCLVFRSDVDNTAGYFVSTTANDAPKLWSALVRKANVVPEGNLLLRKINPFVVETTMAN